MTIQTPDPFISSMVDDASYDDEANEITITINGNDYTWPCDDQMWAAFNRAPSKGRWVRTELEGYLE